MALDERWKVRRQVGGGEAQGAAAWSRNLPTAADLRELAIYLALSPCVLAPRRAGLAVCRLVSFVLTRPGSRYRDALARGIPPALEDQLGPELSAALRLSDALFQYEKVARLRALVAPRWKPAVTVQGLEHIQDARRSGKGAILWVHPCVGSNLLVKLALKRAGFPLTHLSRPEHGFRSNSQFGRWLAPHLRRGEDRYLAARISFDGMRSVGPLRALRMCLREGQVVSITAVPFATRVAEVPFLDGTLRLASGPAELAAVSGAILCPVFTTGSDTVPCVIIGAPLPVVAGELRQAHLAAARMLEAEVVAHPADWLGWRYSAYRGPGGRTG